MTRLSDGLERLREERVGAVFRSIPAGQPGYRDIRQAVRAVPQVPIVVLRASDNEDIARQAAQRGAREYLLKDHLDSYSFPRALRNMIERKAMEEALFVEKERAQVTLNSIGDAVLSTDISGHVTYLNLVAESMTGWSREEASGQPLAEVFQIIDGVTREPARNPLALAVQLDKTVGLTANCILIRRDGFEAAIEDSAAPIHDRAGQVIGAVIVFHDVSAARAMSLQMSICAARLPHGFAEPHAAERSADPGDFVRAPSRQATRGAVRGSGSLQAHQRLAGACDRGPAASVGRADVW